jgi:hypothetical protein
MLKWMKYALVLTICLLVVMGLNVTNQGINSLTMENRKPILSLEIKEKDLYIFALGNQHEYSADFWSKTAEEFKKAGQTMTDKTKKYFNKILEKSN